MCHETLLSKRYVDGSSSRLCAVRHCCLGDVLMIPPEGCAMRHSCLGDMLMVPPVGCVP